MKAIVQTRYGSPDVLQLKDVDKPVVKDDEVLVRVRAAAVNIGDWHLLRGMPYVVRLVAGLRGPRRPSQDVAVLDDRQWRVEAIKRQTLQEALGRHRTHPDHIARTESDDFERSAYTQVCRRWALSSCLIHSRRCAS